MKYNEFFYIWKRSTTPCEVRALMVDRVILQYFLKISQYFNTSTKKWLQVNIITALHHDKNAFITILNFMN